MTTFISSLFQADYFVKSFSSVTVKHLTPKTNSFEISKMYIKMYRDRNDKYIYTVCSIFINKNKCDVLQLFCY